MSSRFDDILEVLGIAVCPEAALLSGLLETTLPLAGFPIGDAPDLEEVYKSATARLEENPDDVEAYFRRGVVCQSKVWSKRALADFLEVLKRQPEHARAWLLLSEVLSKLNQPDPAREARKRALELDPALQ